MADRVIDHLEVLADEGAAALATLVSASGSSSKRIGAKMVVGRSGRLLGGVTIGGCVDAQVVEAADAVISEGARRLLSIALEDDEAWEIGLTCGGTVEVLIDRISARDAADPIVAAHGAARAALDAGRAVTIVAPLDGACAALAIDERGARAGTLGSGAIDDAAVRLAQPGVGVASCVEAIATPDGARRYFFDRLAPPTTLAIVGAGDVAMSLVSMAHELEMRTIVIDGRDRYAARDRFPRADEIRVGLPSEIVGSLRLDRRLYVVLVAHDYKYELPVLRQVLRAGVGYIGLLGSKKRGAAVRELLRAEGYTDAELARVHTPIGLDLGGKSAPEVAMSILAELVAVRAGKRT
jgi:xanthine dehydrogenase accessory factor